MILPTKHIKLENTLLGAGAFILKELQVPRKISELWDNTNIKENIMTFERLILALDLLFMLGIINLNNDLIEKKEGSSYAAQNLC